MVADFQLRPSGEAIAHKGCTDRGGTAQDGGGGGQGRGCISGKRGDASHEPAGHYDQDKRPSDACSSSM